MCHRVRTWAGRAGRRLLPRKTSRGSHAIDFLIKNATTPLNESQQVAGSRGPVSRAGGRDGGEEVTSQENESRESRY